MKKISNTILSILFLVVLIMVIGFVVYQFNPKHLTYTLLPIFIWGIWMWKTDRI